MLSRRWLINIGFVNYCVLYHHINSSILIVPVWLLEVSLLGKRMAAWMWYARPKNIDGYWCCYLLNYICVKLYIPNFTPFLLCILYILIFLDFFFLIFNFWLCWRPWVALLELIPLLVLLWHMSSRLLLILWYGVHISVVLRDYIVKVWALPCFSICLCFSDYVFLPCSLKILGKRSVCDCGYCWIRDVCDVGGAVFLSVIMTWIGCWQGLVLLSTNIVVIYEYNITYVISLKCVCFVNMLIFPGSAVNVVYF